ncbi:MAG TPA: leucyl aminopeptidase [Thiobacillaceae bacterium]|nr:leucyl aminopeptidase [Thiobacillaceae bacterium]HNU64254.1 leucyl aminopeptidase [Thiobacillaceae bacterium]
MEYSIKSGSPEKQRTACVVVGVFENRKLSLAARIIDQAAQGYVADILRRGDMDGKTGSTLLLHSVPGVTAERVLLVGLGRERDLHDKAYRDAMHAAVKALVDTGVGDAHVYLTEIPVKRRDLAWNVEQAVLLAEEGSYRFERMKSKAPETRKGPRRLALAVAARGDLAAATAAATRGRAIAAGMRLAKDLGNMPGNLCTPTYLADQAKALGKETGLKVQVLGRGQIEKLGMGSFLSVAKGSDEPPRFIILEHLGGQKGDKPVVLVGKGITFDSGGISLKPAAEMDEMKYDMCGAASVLGTLQAVATLQLPLNVVGLIPTCENLPSGRANKPGDVVTTLSGQTIEVLNTDAEGRLILCDALTYAERYAPAAVVDIATLTGACVIALGHVATGLLANHDALARELLQAGDAAHDRCWQLPLWEDYQEQLKSNFADMANIGGRPAGTITAACFLSRFTEKYHWAHLDIAGTAWKGGKEKGATGRPVPLLVHFLAKRAAQA